MKKKLITYGVYGMMEYQAVIKIGKKNSKITFSDGSVTAMGINPAKYTTDNIIIQIAIEDSPDFKRGLIRRVNVVELNEDIIIERNKTINIKTEEFAPIESPIAHSGDTLELATGDNSETNNLVELEFSCNDDAKDYIEQAFGVIRSKLRTRADIINAGKAHNVEINFVS